MGNNVVLPYSWLQVCGRVHWSGAIEKQETETLLHSAIVLICSPEGASLPLQPRDMSQTWHKLDETVNINSQMHRHNQQLQPIYLFIYCKMTSGGKTTKIKKVYSPTLLSYTIQCSFLAVNFCLIQQLTV